MNVQVVTALSVAAGREQLPSIRKAREFGLRVVAIDRNPNAPGLLEADEAHVLDPALEGPVIDLAARENVGLVLPAPTGRLLLTVGAVNDALGLRGVSRRCAQHCVDKLLFRERLAASGLGQVKYAVATGRGRILEMLESFPFPCVLKPRFGSGSRGVVVISHPSWVPQLVDAHLSLRTDDGDTLIEEYVVGHEVGIDAAVQNGQLIVTSVREKSVTPLPYRQEIGYAGPAAVSDSELTELRNILRGAVEALSCDNSVFHADVILRANAAPFIVEMAPRPAGLLMTEKMVPEMTGLDFIGESIKLLLGQPADFEPRRNIPVALRFLRFPPGLVVKAANSEWVRSHPGVLDFECNLQPDQRLFPVTQGSDVLSRGYVLATGPTLARAIRTAETVASRVVSTSEVTQ